MKKISVEEFFDLVGSFYYRIEEDDPDDQVCIGEHAKFRNFVNEHADGLCGCGSDPMVAVLFEADAEWSSELPAKLPISEILQLCEYGDDRMHHLDLDDIGYLTTKHNKDLAEEVYNNTSYKLVVGLYMLYYHY